MKRSGHEFLRNLAILAASGGGLAGWLFAFIYSEDTFLAVIGITKSHPLDVSGWVFGGCVVVATWAAPLYGALLMVVWLQPAPPVPHPPPLPTPVGMLR